MPPIKDIRRRIQAVRSTQQVTRAMKLVAAARLRRDQRAALAGRHYSDQLRQTVGHVSMRLGVRAPLMWRRPDEINCMDLVAITSDRGLCGGFNENLLREMERGIEDHIGHNIGVKVFVIGRQGVRYFSRRGYDFEKVPRPEGVGKGREEGITEDAIRWIVERHIERYCARECAGGYIGFNRFAGVSRQEPTFWNLLPLYKFGVGRERHMEYLYGGDRVATLNYVCVEMLSSTIRQAMLESKAAELAARMSAMDAATKNADDMILHLTSEYNKARQEGITSELMDIVGGAEALR